MGTLLYRHAHASVYMHLSVISGTCLCIYQTLSVSDVVENVFHSIWMFKCSIFFPFLSLSLSIFKSGDSLRTHYCCSSYVYGMCLPVIIITIIYYSEFLVIFWLLLRLLLLSSSSSCIHLCLARRSLCSFLCNHALSYAHTHNSFLSSNSSSTDECCYFICRCPMYVRLHT